MPQHHSTKHVKNTFCPPCLRYRYPQVIQSPEQFTTMGVVGTWTIAGYSIFLKWGLFTVYHENIFILWLLIIFYVTVSYQICPECYVMKSDNNCDTYSGTIGLIRFASKFRHQKRLIIQKSLLFFGLVYKYHSWPLTVEEQKGSKYWHECWTTKCIFPLPHTHTIQWKLYPNKFSTHAIYRFI